MATQAQIDANRRNAKNSTGPRGDEGKATVARNAVTHGFYCQHLILPGEDEAELQSLRQSIYARFQPADDVEKLYAERFVVAAWKLKRFIASEPTCMDGYRVDVNEFAAHCTIHQEHARKMTAAMERSMDKALAELTKLQKNRPERAIEQSQTEIVENKPNSDPLTAQPASAGSADPVTDDQTASMKIEIVKTNPIHPSPAPEETKIEETNPIYGAPDDPDNSRGASPAAK